MTAIELKKKLISKIGSINDESILKELLRFLEEEENCEEIYYFTDEELKAVKEAEEQYKKGEYVSAEQADKIIKEWLEK